MQVKKTIALFFIITMTLVFSIHEERCAKYTVIIDPAGDAKITGRKIGDSFERGITLQMAEKIKGRMSELAPHIKVIITRMPGDLVYDLQNASLSNRVNANLYIHLSLYHCHDPKPMIHLYQFSYGNDIPCTLHNFDLHSYEQAYRINKHKTDTIKQLFYQRLSQQQYQSLFTVTMFDGIPLKPLIGVVAPALLLEMGLKNKESWNSYIEPLTASILAAFEDVP